MDPAEVIEKLRDIHTPPLAATPAAEGFSLWPLAVFAALAAVALVLSRVRAAAWRREARRELERARHLAEPETRCVALTALLQRIARHKPGVAAPAFLHRPPSRIGSVEIDQLEGEIARLIE